MIALLDYAKGKGVDRATLEARMGSGESLRETLNAVEQLGLATRDESGNIHLTESGERLAYAVGDADRSAELSRAMLSYPPYAIPLDRAVAEGLSVLDAAWVERIWQVDMRLAQPRNRVEEARTFYFRLADEGGLGVYRRGVRGQPTRSGAGCPGSRCFSRSIKRAADGVTPDHGRHDRLGDRKDRGIPPAPRDRVPRPSGVVRSTCPDTLSDHALGVRSIGCL
jgi:hypothetical protein